MSNKVEMEFAECTECVKMVYSARYCSKCKIRSFCTDSCKNANIHECFNTDIANIRKTKITALTKILIQPGWLRDAYKTVNKPNRVKRRRQKHLFRLIIDDNSKIYDIIQNPNSYFDQISVSSMNEITESIDTLVLDWNNIMCIIMYKAEDMEFIELLQVPLIP